MLNAIEKLSKEFLEETKNKPVRIISHHDTDGITSATIVARALKKLDKKFSIKIVKGLDDEIVSKELLKNKSEVIIFTDLASSNLDYFQNIENPIFIIDHHEIDKKKLNEKIKIVNPHLFDEEEICGAGLSYLFAKAISLDNKELSKLAIIGMIGDRHEKNISKFYQQIIQDTKDLEIKKGLAIYPATRPLRRALEYSTSPYIPGVTGNSDGVLDLLRETNIPSEKSLLELDDKEMSRLITSIMLKMTKGDKRDEVIGNLYILKFFNRKEDVRELSTLINACSRLGYYDVAISLCFENEKTKNKALDIYTEYKQELITGLRVAEQIEKIKGNGFVILNVKDKIKDAIVGTVCSMLSSSLNYEEGTVLIGMAYNKDKIKVSARIVGREGKNLKEILEKTIVGFKQKHPNANVEVGGHEKAAGCLIEKDKESDFIQELQKNLEIEIVKI